MRSLSRFALVVAFVGLVFSARPAAACEGGYGVPTQYEITILYYNASQQLVGYEIYNCAGGHFTSGTLEGVWIKETDRDCCTNQSTTGYFYLCDDEIYHTVDYIGDTDCS